MSQEHFIVIGNGPAGNQAAHTLIEMEPGSRVTLISKDYDSCLRPHLLPRYIAGKIPRDTLFACPIDAYNNAGIKLRTGQEVVHVNLNKREVILEHKEVIPFTGLIIAVGGKPRIPEPLLVFKDFMLTLKTLEDAALWMEGLKNVHSVLMVGGDLTSFSLTRALIGMGKKVHFMFNEDAFWPMRPDEKMFEEATFQLTEKGVDVLHSRRLKGLARLSEKSIQVHMDDRKITVGIVGAFFGLKPDVRFLAKSGLLIDRGILVDETLYTGFEGVYATGDCAQVYHPEIRDYWVSIGHDNAVALGHVAAMNLLGADFRADVPKESILDVQGVKVNTSWWKEF